MSGIARGRVSPVGWQGATAAPHTERSAVAPVFWRGAPWLAIALVAIVVARLHEVIPSLQVVRPAFVGSAALLLILLLQANREMWRRLFSLTTTQLLCAYVAWAAVTIPFAFWPGLAFTTVLDLLPGTAMFIAVVMCAPTRVNLDRLQLGLVVALAIFAVGSLLWGPRVVIGRVGGVGATYDPNDMATAMAVGFPLAAGLMSRVAGVRRFLLLAAVFAFGAAVAASASRGGMVAFGVGAVVLAAGQRGSRRMVHLAAIGLGAIVVWLSAGPVARERAASVFTLQGDYNLQDPNGRIAVWKRGATYFLDHPILGVGAGNFEMAEGASLEARGERGKWSAAHNAYIQAFADLGVVGGTIFVSLLGLGGWQARRLWRPPRSRLSPSFHRPELLAALSAFAVGACFLSFAYSAILVGLIGFISLAADTARAELGAGPRRGAPIPLAPRFWRSS